MNLIGVHELRVDTKGRLALPSSLRKQLSGIESEGFVIKRSIFQRCLEVYPMQTWNGELGQINRLNRFVRKNNDFIRAFMAGVRVVEADDAGRLLIPRDLVIHAAINHEVVLACSIDRFEIWDKGLYESFVSETSTDFGQLAEDVMGQQTEPDNH